MPKNEKRIIKFLNRWGSPINFAIHESCIVPYSEAYTSSLITLSQKFTASINSGGFNGNKFNKGVNKIVKLNKNGNNNE